MPDFSTLLLFIAAALALLITPGPAVLYIIARSVHQGKLAGIVSTFGLATGTLFHIGAAAFGLSAILLSSALAFSVVKYAGAAYLIYLGITKLIAQNGGTINEGPRASSYWSIFRQGIAVNILNPKTALFFFAFLPQFVRPAHGAVALQILILGFIFVLLGILTDSAYALLSGTVMRRLKRNSQALRTERYFAGLVYIGLGVTTALSDAKAK